MAAPMKSVVKFPKCQNFTKKPIKVFLAIVIIVIYPTQLLCQTTNQSNDDIKLTKYRERVVAMFQHAYDGYIKFAYPYDELRPLTCDGHDTWGSFSLTLIDALDTLAILGNDTEFRRVANLIVETADFNRDVNVSVFETNIRVVGGLLSAHLLTERMGMELDPGWPCSGPLLALAENVARQLLPAFNTPTKMPYGTVNLRYGVPVGETPVTCTACVGTYILEFTALSHLTGDPVFEETASAALDALWNARSEIDLVGNHIDVQTGQWTALDSGIGGGIDSYFEYLVKAGVMYKRTDLLEMFKVYEASVEKHTARDDWYLIAHMTKGTITQPLFQSLEAFWPGIQSLTGEIEKGMKTIHNYHQIWQQFGFTPEMYNIPKSMPHATREGYPLRPELIESAMYLYRATGDPYLLEIGYDIADSIADVTATSCGFATVKNVNSHRLENRMESFFLSETAKYLYLLFTPDHFIHNTGSNGRVIKTPRGECVIDSGGYVFNTEAHPFDSAAVHCCSAQKKQEDSTLERFHNDLDLLTLFGIVDPVNVDPVKDSDPVFDNVGKIRLNKNWKSDLGDFNDVSMDYLRKLNVELGDLKVKSMEVASENAAEKAVENAVKTDLHGKSGNKDSQEYLEENLDKTKEENVPVDTNKKTVDNNEKMQEKTDENSATKSEKSTIFNQSLEDVLASLKTSVSGILQKKFQENSQSNSKINVLLENIFTVKPKSNVRERTHKWARSFKPELLTCPALPFHTKFSVMGEIMEPKYDE